jgi:hypothetical protein
MQHEADMQNEKDITSEASMKRQTLVPAAQYLRTSTRQQPHSIQTQKSAILSYALRNGFVIVRTYEDRGRSGLRPGNRPAL